MFRLFRHSLQNILFKLQPNLRNNEENNQIGTKTAKTESNKIIKQTIEMEIQRFKYSR